MEPVRGVGRAHARAVRRPRRPGSTDQRAPGAALATEREVLVAVGTGASNAEIAAALFLSEATVKAHVSHLFTKTGCTDRVRLALHAHHTAPPPAP